MFDPYILGGFGILNHNPEARTPEGQFGGTWVSLPEIGTEGQNLGFSEKYSNIQVAFLGGFGVNYKISDRASFGLRFAYRQTLTDYLDDVGGAYIDKNEFKDNELARQLSDRSMEVTSITTGSIRDIERMQELGLKKYSYTNNTGVGEVEFETLNGYYPAGDSYSESLIPRGGGANDGYWVSSIRFSYIISNTKKDDALSRIYQIHEKPAKKVDDAIPDEFLKFTNRYDLTHLIHLSGEASEIPTGFYKDGILIDSDRADARNKSGRKDGSFYNIYYVPFSDLQKAELIAPVIVGDTGSRQAQQSRSSIFP